MTKRLFSLLLVCSASLADTTSGGVSWSDTLGYSKPKFYPITVPNEASASHKWYVDLGSGSGTTCSSGSPCAWTGINGKAGINDGTGAYVYIKGSGTIGGTSSDFSISGASGAEVVVKPWDDSTTATITGRNNWTQNKHYVIFDGGPNSQIRFSSTSGGQYDPSIYISESASNTAIQNVTFYRTRWSVPVRGEWFASWGAWTNLKFINSEFEALATITGTYNTEQHHMYLSQNGTSGAGDGTTGSGLYIINSIFRDTPGEAIEMRMSDSGSNITGGEIAGNAFHDAGKGTCANSGWHCRSAITMAEGTISNLTVANNLLWDLGENCIRVWSTDSTDHFYNNTCYNWGALGSDSYSGGYPAYGFCGSSPVSAYSGDFRNNIVYRTSGTYNGTTINAFASGGSATRTYNGCASGQYCGTANGQVVSSATFLSLDENNANFLKLADGVQAPVDTGTAAVCTSPDYFGTATRSPCDIGAYEYVAAGGDTTPPTVSMTAPSNGATVSGSVTVSATASDDVGVVGVQFKLDGSNLGTEDTSSPYSINWDSTAATNASHTLSAHARDAAGNSADATNITVTVDNSAPALSSVGPSGMQALGTTSVNLVATTDESATCRYAATSGTAHGSKTIMSSDSGGAQTSHSQAISTKPGGVYHYWISCQDATGHTSADSQADFWIYTVRKHRRH